MADLEQDIVAYAHWLRDQSDAGATAGVRTVPADLTRIDQRRRPWLLAAVAAAAVGALVIGVGVVRRSGPAAPADSTVVQQVRSDVELLPSFVVPVVGPPVFVDGKTVYQGAPAEGTVQFDTGALGPELVLGEFDLEDFGIPVTPGLAPDTFVVMGMLDGDVVYVLTDGEGRCLYVGPAEGGVDTQGRCAPSDVGLGGANGDFFMNWWNLPPGTVAVSFVDETNGSRMWQRPAANTVVFPVPLDDNSHPIRLEALDAQGATIVTVTNGR